jgi:tetratricopeptide (TPR) repeat protein
MMRIKAGVNRLIVYMCLLIAVISAVVGVACMAQGPAAGQFLEGVEAYKSADYTRAIDSWQAIAHSGVQNGELFYNLGNAYLKNNDLGRALLWYEKALALIPDDPDLTFNINYARSLTRDAPAQQDLPIQHILFFWKYQLRARTIRILALAFNLVLWSAAAAFVLTGRRGFRRAAYLATLPTLLFLLTAAFIYYERAYGRSEAIVLPARVAVRSGLQAGSTELFQLHAGAKVNVLKKLNGHVQVRFSKDKIGWLPRDQVGLI